MNPTPSTTPQSSLLPAELLDQESRVIANGRAVLLTAREGRFQIDQTGTLDTLASKAAFLRMNRGAVQAIENVRLCVGRPPHLHFEKVNA